MSRARLIVKEITIQKQGEVSFFQIRLPKNVKRIIGVETDVVIISEYVVNNAEPARVNDDGTISPIQINYTPFLTWNTRASISLGKLKLQSRDRIGIFFESWVSLILFGAGIPDMSFGLFPVSPYSLNTNIPPKKVNLQCKHSSIEGYFEDDFGKQQQRDMTYLLKIFVWIETTEENKGLVFDFQLRDEKHKTESEIKNQLDLKI